MRNGCLPKLRSIYLWKRESKKEEKKIGKAREVLNLIDSTAANKNSSLREEEVIAYENHDDSLARDINLRVVGVAYDEKLNEKITAEQGLESVDVNRTQAEQDLAQHQAKTIRGYKGVASPNFGDSSNQSASGDGLTIRLGLKRPHNELNKVKTFEVRGVESSGKGREANAKEFNKVKTFDLRGLKISGKGKGTNGKEFSNSRTIQLGRSRSEERVITENAKGMHRVESHEKGVHFREEESDKISNEFHKIRTFDLRGVKSSG